MAISDPVARLRTVATQHRDAADDMLLYERWDEALGHYARAEKMFAEANDVAAVVDVLFASARAARLAGKPAVVHAALVRANDVARNAGLVPAHVRALALLAQTAEDAARPDEARRLWTEVLPAAARLAPSDGADAFLGTAHGRLAELAIAASDPTTASTHIAAATIHATAAEDAETLAALATSSGRLHRLLGHIDAAETAFGQALNAWGALREMGRMADVLGQLGNLKRESGNLRSAKQLFESSLTMAESASDAVAAASALTNLANIDLALDDPDSARRRYREVIDMATACNHVETLLGALVNLANLEAAALELESARNRYQQALAVVRDLGIARLEVDISMLLAQLDARDGRFTQAAEMIASATEKARSIGHELGLARLAVNRAALLQAAGRISEALEAYRAGLKAFTQLQRPADTIVAALALAECALAAADFETASSAIATARNLITDDDQREALDIAIVSARLDHASSAGANAVTRLLELADLCDSKQRPMDAMAARFTVADRLAPTDPNLRTVLSAMRTVAPARLETPARLEMASLDAWQRGDIIALETIADEASVSGLALLAIRIGRRLVEVLIANDQSPQPRLTELVTAAETTGYHAEIPRLRRFAAH